MTPRVIAVDWSGTSRYADRKIWLAEVQAGRVIRVEAGRDRDAITAHLIEEAQCDNHLIVGFDFAFSLPRWFLEARALEDGPSLWTVVEQEGERWLANCAHPFWGRPGICCPDLPAHLRATDRHVPAVNGIRPKSVFQIGGAGAVGTGSLRGMPLLRRLRDAGFAIWPFDPPRVPLTVEIYPRALTGAVRKRNLEARQRYLSERFPGVEPWAVEAAIESEDAFDALVSAIIMAEHAAQFTSLPTATTEADRLEGRIWLPA